MQLSKIRIRAAPHNSARSLRQDFCSNSKFRKWRNTVCISHFRNCGSGAKRRLRLADAIVRCCLSYWGNFKFYSTARAWGPVGSKNRPIEQSLFIDEYYKQELISNDIGLRSATASYIQM